jgi:hypothetical protein
MACALDASRYGLIEPASKRVHTADTGLLSRIVSVKTTANTVVGDGERRR